MWKSIARKFSLSYTPLSKLNKDVLKGRMVPFAGYSMPVEFKEVSGGGMAEHKHVRTQIGLFDVSHMGVLKITGKSRVAFLSKLVVADLPSLNNGQAVYSLIMNEHGGIVDDTIITKYEDHILMVVNAGCKYKDLKFMSKHMINDVKIQHLLDYGLMAMQGPGAAKELQTILKENLNQVKFMNGFYTTIEKVNTKAIVTRCGYTGEDGFEIIVEPDKAVALAELLLSLKNVKPIGLGARDSLRLEAGLCLYGHDLNEEITPIEAGLIWAIPKSRRESGGFLGAEVVKKQIAEGVSKKRIGFKMSEGSSVREGAIVSKNGAIIGSVCSGGYSPTLKHPVGMAYIDAKFATIDTELEANYRGKDFKVTVCKMPFHPTNYFK